MHLDSNTYTNHLLKHFKIYDDTSMFDYELEYMEKLVEPNVLQRLKNWTNFINDNQTKCLGIYWQTMNVLNDAAINNELFRTQTKHEFETSLSFYSQLLNSSIFLETEDKNNATYLLNISLIYGKYPGMVIRSLRLAFKKLKMEKMDLITFFHDLFVKYEAPEVLTNNINYLSITEIEALMYVLQGNNIRNFDNLPLPISRRESYFLINHVPSYLFKDNILERSITFAKLLNVRPQNKDDLSLILASSKFYHAAITEDCESL